MNRIKTVFTLLLMFSVMTLLAENNKTITYSLQWKSVQYAGDSDKGHLFFENAIYSKIFNEMPYHSEMIAVNKGEIIAAIKFIDITTTPLNSEENACVDIANLSDSIKYRISYQTQRAQRYAVIDILPLAIKNGAAHKINKYTVVMDIVRTDNDAKKSVALKDNSVLSNGDWYKIKIHEEGVYKVTYSDLKNWGVDVDNMDINKIGLFGNGGSLLPEMTDQYRHDDLVENPISINLGSDGVFNNGDYFLFYGDNTVYWDYKTVHLKYYHHPNYFSEYTYYFFSPNQGTAKQMADAELSDEEATHIVNEYDALKYYDNNDYSLIKSGREWFGNKMDAAVSSVTIPDFTFKNVVAGSRLYLQSDVAGRSEYNTKLRVYANNEEVYFHYLANNSGDNYAFAKKSVRRSKFDASGDKYTIRFDYEAPTSTSMAWINWVELQARCNLIYDGEDLVFRDHESVGEGNVAEYHITNGDACTVWEITDVVNTKVVNGDVVGNNIVFKANADSLRRFIAFSEYKSTEFVEVVENQNLHAIKNIDFLIIAHNNFLEEADRLSDFHLIKDGISSQVVDIQKIYNEFGSGIADITAIRDFVRHVYSSSNDDSKLKYLLLFGDASYDVNSENSKNTNFVPTYQSYESLNTSESYCTDDYFALLDDGEGHNDSEMDSLEGLLDIGVGRFPSKTSEEATLLVDKVVGYYDKKSFGEWRNQICLIGDDEDSNVHFNQAEELAMIIDTGYVDYNLQKIYLDAFHQEVTPGGPRYPDVNEAITQQMSRSALIMNYTGHGGETGLAHERVLTIPEIENWSNVDALPLFITATCEFSTFDDPSIESAGEKILLHNNGGGIALLTTTRIAFSFNNHVLNTRVFRQLFEKKGGEYQRLGDFVVAAKSPNTSKLYNYVLLGDPALQLAYPDYNVVTTQINGVDVEMFSDTIKALSKVIISGEIRENGALVKEFNGTVVPIVYDKKYTSTTLGNDPKSFPAEFELQNSVLYKGKASVENGHFSFEFVVPKDINYSYGSGKISYYANNDFVDAIGSYSNFIVGGASENNNADDQGPDITVYMNDREFVEGETVNDNPLLIADIFDESGINTVGNGIGHDIVAYLDGNTSKSISLNEYYSAELNSYKKGTVLYTYTNLEDGVHTLTIKAWDVYNNSSEKTISFNVSGNIKPNITELKNYPNPFDNETKIAVTHNQFNERLNTTVSIYSFEGRLVKQIGPEDIQADGYFLPEIQWDGTDGNGNRMRKGLYVYHVIITNTKGVTTSQGGKMIKVL